MAFMESVRIFLGNPFCGACNRPLNRMPNEANEVVGCHRRGAVNTTGIDRQKMGVMECPLASRDRVLARGRLDGGAGGETQVLVFRDAHRNKGNAVAMAKEKTGLNRPPGSVVRRPGLVQAFA
jgi:hypothetical protein